MAHVTFRGVTSDVQDLVEGFISKLEAAGHGGTILRDGEPEPAVDPFAGMDPDTIPEEVLSRVGISRAELKRGREFRPAVDPHAVTAAAPAPGS